MFTLLPKRSLRCLTASKYMTSLINTNNYCKESLNNKNTNSNNKNIKDVLGGIASKYKVFRNEDSSVIFDINEERLSQQSHNINEEKEYDEFDGLNLERGVTGVYDIEDLVEVLKRENAQNIFVASVPSEFKYVDYICIISGKSYRHMLAIAQFVRRVFKFKRNANDILPKIEGENSRQWIAMDLGNIALHIFSNEARVKYDLESLWSLGEEFDDECNKPDDPIVKLLQQHSIYLKDLQPAELNT